MPIDRNELRRLALLLSLGASAAACGGSGRDTTTSHGDPTAGGNGNGTEPADEATYEPTAEVYPTDEAYYDPSGEAYYGGPTGENYPSAEGPVYEG